MKTIPVSTPTTTDIRGGGVALAELDPVARVLDGRFVDSPEVRGVAVDIVRVDRLLLPLVCPLLDRPLLGEALDVERVLIFEVTDDRVLVDEATVEKVLVKTLPVEEESVEEDAKIGGVRDTLSMTLVLVD